ncbi:hypothetical protein LTR70_001006 [Exophiala xenobiotica]|nr:hypothetical protein LTR70_001006 [Exophiala xenobiotica]
MGGRGVRAALRLSEFILSFETTFSVLLVLYHQNLEHNKFVLALIGLGVLCIIWSLGAFFRGLMDFHWDVNDELDHSEKWRKRALIADAGLAVAWIVMFSLLVNFADSDGGPPWVDVFFNIPLFIATAVADWATLKRSQQKKAANINTGQPASDSGGNFREPEANTTWTPAFRQAAELQEDIQRIELPANVRV